MGEYIEREAMTLSTFARMAHTPIKVMSGYDGRVLCRQFDEKKHPHLADREVISVWAEIYATKAMTYGNIARAQLCVYLHGYNEAKMDGERRSE